MAFCVETYLVCCSVLCFCSHFRKRLLAQAGSSPCHTAMDSGWPCRPGSLGSPVEDVASVFEHSALPKGGCRRPTEKSSEEWGSPPLSSRSASPRERLLASASAETKCWPAVKSHSEKPMLSSPLQTASGTSNWPETPWTEKRNESSPFPGKVLTSTAVKPQGKGGTSVKDLGRDVLVLSDSDNVCIDDFDDDDEDWEDLLHDLASSKASTAAYQPIREGRPTKAPSQRVPPAPANYCLPVASTAQNKTTSGSIQNHSGKLKRSGMLVCLLCESKTVQRLDCVRKTIASLHCQKSALSGCKFLLII